MSTSDALKQEDETGIIVDSTKFPLIDVDCNLWHKDLKPLLSVSSTADDTDPLLAILRHDAIEQANIVAVLSPSSTIAEAKVGIQALQQLLHKENQAEQQQQQQYSEKPANENCNISLPRIRTTVGVHPYHVNDDDCRDQMQERLAEAAQLLEENKSNNIIAAIGECGLDASEGFPPLQDQIPWFQAQIQLAVDYNLPLFVHERFAHSETMDLLKHVPAKVPVIIHCFTGTRQECKAYMERGYYISFSGYICKNTAASQQQDDKSAKNDDPVVETISCLIENLIPLDRLMIETDAPYLGFAGCRDLYFQKHTDAIQALPSKKRKRILGSTYPNLPSALPLVLRKVCNAMNQGRRENGEKEISLEELARQTSHNANRFFQFGVSDMLDV